MLCRSWRSGREVAALYEQFVEAGEGVFSRSAGGDRVVETAGYWMEVGPSVVCSGLR